MHTLNSSLRNISLYTIILILTQISFAQEAEITDDSETTSTYGTFHFIFNDGEQHMLPLNEIESLYHDIELRRQESSTFYWIVNENMTVVIYSTEALEGEFFVRKSPFERLKTPE